MEENQLISAIEHHYRIEITHLQKLFLGADLQAAVFKVQTCERDYFLKVKKGKFLDQGGIYTNYLHELGVAHIIAPVKTYEGRLDVKLKEMTLFLYPFIKAENGFSRRLSKLSWIELGKVVKKIHATLLPQILVEKIKKENFSQKAWLDVEDLCNKHETFEANTTYARKFKNFIQEHYCLIQHLLDQTKDLHKKIQNKECNFVFCHADLHAGNILIDEKEQFYIVDWDDPILAPKERDLMFIGAGVGNVWNQPEEVAFFYEGYGKKDIDLDLLMYYRCQRILEDIAEYAKIFFGEIPAEDLASCYKHFLDIFAPCGCLEIAFSGHL